jgi:hypothetical protein
MIRANRPNTWLLRPLLLTLRELLPTRSRPHMAEHAARKAAKAAPPPKPKPKVKAPKPAASTGVPALHDRVRGSLLRARSSPMR